MIRQSRQQCGLAGGRDGNGRCVGRVIRGSDFANECVVILIGIGGRHGSYSPSVIHHSTGHLRQNVSADGQIDESHGKSRWSLGRRPSSSERRRRERTLMPW
jgi:hypothetical protein